MNGVITCGTSGLLRHGHLNLFRRKVPGSDGCRPCLPHRAGAVFPDGPIPYRKPDCLPRHNIVYSFPFFLAGGLLYIHRDRLDIRSLAGRLALLAAALAAGVIQFTPFRPAPSGENNLYAGFVFVLWIAYAATGGIAIRGFKLLDNPVAAFLGRISMEIYLCHMMVFRAIGQLHPERFVRDPQLLYWLRCALGLASAIAFSWFVVEKVLPLWAGCFRKTRLGRTGPAC